MAIKFKCDECSKVLSVKDDFAGKKVKCPGCSHVLRIPAAGAAGAAEKPAEPAVEATKPKASSPPKPSATQAARIPAVKTNVSCEACNSTFNDLEWKPGMKCIGCGSDKFFPAVETDDTDASGNKTTSKTASKTKAKTRGKVKSVKASKGGEGSAWKNSPIVGGVLILAILFAWGNMFMGGGSGSSSGIQIDITCIECKETYRGGIPKGERPWECEKCGKKAAYTAMKCKVDATVVPIINPMPPKMNETCEKCGKEMRLEGIFPPSLVCTDFECNNYKMFYSFYCKDDKHVWNVMPKEGVKFKTPTKCPQCSSEKIIHLEEFTPSCPVCQGTALAPITPRKKKGKKRRKR